ncbi:hypothetical protein N7527_004799 [Penicillium freii]|nr:hypothetical protein N7527_004799 [Penicillium freii]
MAKTRLPTAGLDHVQELESWEQELQYAPTPEYFRSSYATRSNYSPSLSILLENEPNHISQIRPNTMPLLQLSEWNDDSL